MGAGAIDYERRRVTVDGREVAFTATEYEIPRILSVDAGRLVTSDSLLRQDWHAPVSTDTDRVLAFVKQIRAQLGDDATDPSWIFNERGVGYRMQRPGRNERRRRHGLPQPRGRQIVRVFDFGSRIPTVDPRADEATGRRFAAPPWRARGMGDRDHEVHIPPVRRGRASDGDPDRGLPPAPVRGTRRCPSAPIEIAQHSIRRQIRQMFHQKVGFVRLARFAVLTLRTLDAIRYRACHNPFL